MSHQTSGETKPDSNRLRWQCRRGMLELDCILERFLDQVYSDLDETSQRAFEQLLTTPDPELHSWLLGGVEAPEGFQTMVESIRQCKDTARSSPSCS
jgi:antitoxin CptB